VKRNRLIACALVLSLCILSTPAAGERFAIGAFGGYQWPIVQDDAEGGALFGGKAKIHISPMFDIEPNVTWIQNGDADTELGGTIPAPEVISYMLNGNLHFGGSFGITGGIGWSSVDIPATGSTNNFSFNLGLALEIPVGPLALDISPRFLLINTESGASRKHGLVMAGLNYWF
jgi:hypothetical protein